MMRFAVAFAALFGSTWLCKSERCTIEVVSLDEFSGLDIESRRSPFVVRGAVSTTWNLVDRWSNLEALVEGFGSAPVQARLPLGSNVVGLLHRKVRWSRDTPRVFIGIDHSGGVYSSYARPFGWFGVHEAAAD